MTGMHIISVITAYPPINPPPILRLRHTRLRVPPPPTLRPATTNVPTPELGAKPIRDFAPTVTRVPQTRSTDKKKNEHNYPAKQILKLTLLRVAAMFFLPLLFALDRHRRHACAGFVVTGWRTRGRGASTHTKKKEAGAVNIETAACQQVAHTDNVRSTGGVCTT